jgi:hypothetical protein
MDKNASTRTCNVSSYGVLRRSRVLYRHAIAFRLDALAILSHRFRLAALIAGALSIVPCNYDDALQPPRAQPRLSGPRQRHMGRY